ncbi:MAG: HAMP domain-containing sensor histidine kinase [Hespellia sp.]|nr:HAMP domain-containing sensor histidine kinase [Hespellia sp.]
MVTKLKKLTKRQREILISAGWIFLVAFLCLIKAHAVYSQLYYGYSNRIETMFHIFVICGSIASVLAAVALLRASVIYLKAYPPREHMKRIKADSLGVEWIVIAEIAAALLWWKGTAENFDYPEVFGLYMADSVSRILQYVLTMFVLTGIIYLGGILLVRKGIYKNWKETSFICKAIQKYKMRTPLEKQILHRSRFYLGIVIVMAVGSFWCAYMLCEGPAMIQEIVANIQIGLTAAGVLVFVIYYVRNHIYTDIGKLSQQIAAMAEGKEIPETAILPETSLLASSASQLGNIEHAMKKSMDKQVQAERLKIDLVTNVSHDLKTPLTSMIGYADLLKKEDLSPEARDYVEAISVKQEQLKDMIQDLFELAKSTSNSENLQMEPLDMEKLVQQILADMEDAVTESSCVFRTTFTETPALFLGDNRKMYRVVQNLVENALKYSMKGTRIYVTVDKEPGWIQMEMKNIAAKEMRFTPDEIIERFNRGDESRSTQGHGLGLAIASSFTQNMGGTMKVEIDGDLFKVTLRFPESV